MNHLTNNYMSYTPPVNYITGNTDPTSCKILQQLGPDSDMVFVCFGGIWCDENNGNCKDLDGCGVRGNQNCSFFERPMLDKSVSFNTGGAVQYVYKCGTDPLRVAAFTMGVMTCILFVVIFLWRLDVFEPLGWSKHPTTLDEIHALKQHQQRIQYMRK